ncbi:MAG: aldehyde dehydrogenase family protein [Alphaproteobacteria bacterium]|nr:aldehyde dehydrogenase family protein [Alphaproteobacteria bacterium]
MRDYLNFYVNGAWTPSSGQASGDATLDVIDPSTERPFARIAVGAQADVDAAVAAARRAFPAFAASTVADRMLLLGRIIEAYKARLGDLAEAVRLEMGAPARLAGNAQAPAGLAHLATAQALLDRFPFVEDHDGYSIRREPIGVVAMVTPWNWPLNQIACKVAPAIAAGCTMVLKPSEIAPVSAMIFAEIMDAAGTPPGVFNLVNGDGPTVGAALARHPDVDMVSFTGSTRAGVEVAIGAAPTVKRVAQELGGKSPNILLDDVDFARAVPAAVHRCMNNSGQSCNAPTRLLVPRARAADVADIAAATANSIVVGPPSDDGVGIGPVVSERQWTRIQELIESGMRESARLAAGGPGRPQGLNAGYYVRPTVFADVNNEMTIAREEIFGPVLVIIPYTDDNDAIRIANDTPYGLSAYVSGGDADRVEKIVAGVRAGQVHVNGGGTSFEAPFGGYKASGNGREWGVHGMSEFLETKAVIAA